MKRNRRVHDPFPFAAMVSRPTCRLRPLFSCSLNPNAALRALRPRHRERLASHDHPRSCRSWLPWRRLWLKLSRSFLLCRLRFFFGFLFLLCFRLLLFRFLFSFVFLRDGLILFCVLLVQLYLSCGILNRRPNDHITPITTGNCAADQNHFLGLAHLHHLQVLHSYALVPEMTGHAHVLPNAAGSGTISDGTIAAMRL